MIENAQSRREIARKLAGEADDLVRERMKGLTEEPDITSRIGQRLEDRFNNTTLHGYRIRVITETITSHGSTSLEKPMGTDLYFAISVEDKWGNETTKGVLVQAKRKDKMDRSALSDQCRRMNMITQKGSVVWIYSPSGIEVARSQDATKPNFRVFSAEKLFDRIFECKLGDLRKVPDGQFGDRAQLKKMIEALGARNAVWLALEEQ